MLSAYIRLPDDSLLPLRVIEIVESEARCLIADGPLMGLEQTYAEKDLLSLLVHSRHYDPTARHFWSLSDSAKLQVIEEIHEERQKKQEESRKPKKRPSHSKGPSKTQLKQQERLSKMSPERKALVEEMLRDEGKL